MGRRRALAGTVAGYQRCATCGHARVAHLGRGAGPCSRSIVTSVTDEQGRTITTSARCECTGFTTSEELH
jgi:hypothetical protein